jgi:hypothetical protein
MSFNIQAGLQRGAALLGAINGLLPVIGALAQSAEQLFPAAGSGAQKLSHVTDIIKNALAFGGAAIADVEAIVPAIQSSINAIVAAAKGPLPAPPPSPAPAPGA